MRAQTGIAFPSLPLLYFCFVVLFVVVCIFSLSIGWRKRRRHESDPKGTGQSAHETSFLTHKFVGWNGKKKESTKERRKSSTAT